jgi:uncharacterized membrane protein (GlpM family)
MEMLLLSLALKVAMTAGIVVAASIVVERSGPFVGALIASLPTAGGAALIILAFEHPPSFIAHGVIGSMVAIAMVTIFALAYATLAQRFSLLWSLGGAYAVWFAAAYLTLYVPWTATRAALLAAVVIPVTIALGRRFRVAGDIRHVPVTAADIAWRAAVVTLCVLIVTAASYSIGSFASGLFAFMPVAMGSFFVILQPRLGGPAAASVAAHVQAPLIGLVLGLLAVHFLAEPIGVWWSYLIGLGIGLAWNALLWLARRFFYGTDLLHGSAD